MDSYDDEYENATKGCILSFIIELRVHTDAPIRNRALEKYAMLGPKLQMASITANSSGRASSHLDNNTSSSTTYRVFDIDVVVHLQ